MMDAIKKTLVKYFVSDDGSVSMGAVGIALLSPVVTVVMAKELWPLSVDDILKLSVSVPSTMAAIGWYRKVGKK